MHLKASPGLKFNGNKFCNTLIALRKSTMETTRDLFEAINKGLSQEGRLLKLDTTLGKDVLLPHRIVAQDRLGRGYQYKLDVLTLKKDIELKDLIAQPITLWIQQTNRFDYIS